MTSHRAVEVSTRDVIITEAKVITETIITAKDQEEVVALWVPIVAVVTAGAEDDNNFCFLSKDLINSYQSQFLR